MVTLYFFRLEGGGARMAEPGVSGGGELGPVVGSLLGSLAIR